MWNSLASKLANSQLRLLGKLLGVWLCVCSASSFAADLYVSPRGSDSNPGTTVASAWRTLQKAADNAVAGDTVWVAGGLYSEKLTLSRSGTSAKYIAFRNNPGEIPTIDGIGSRVGQYDALVLLTNVAYVRIEGLTIRNSPFWGLYIGGESHHLQLTNLDIYDSKASGIMIDGPHERPAFTVLNKNKIHHNTQGGITLWISKGGYYRIEENEVFANSGGGNYDGVQIGGGNGATHHIIVKNNIIHDNGKADKGEDNLDLGGHGISHHYLVEGNTIFGGTGSFKLHSGSMKDHTYSPGKSGFHIARHNNFTRIGFVSYGFPNPIVLYHNTFVDAGQAFMIYNEDDGQNKNSGDSSYLGGDAGRMNIKNNIFWQEEASTSHIALAAGPGSIDISERSINFRNNLFKRAEGQKLEWPGLLPEIGKVSLIRRLFGSKSIGQTEVANLQSTSNAVEMFRNYHNRDYRLVAESPAIDAGSFLTKAITAGNKAIILKADRASYFQDGYCVGDECLGNPDQIYVQGSGLVSITKIDDAKNEITLAEPKSWSIGAGISLPFAGKAPDLGEFEFRR